MATKIDVNNRYQPDAYVPGTPTVPYGYTPVAGYTNVYQDPNGVAYIMNPQTGALSPLNVPNDPGVVGTPGSSRSAATTASINTNNAAGGIQYDPSRVDPTQVVPHSDEYWKTHTATTPEGALEKRDAYFRAVQNGEVGYPYLNQDELALIGVSYKNGLEARPSTQDVVNNINNNGGVPAGSKYADIPGIKTSAPAGSSAATDPFQQILQIAQQNRQENNAYIDQNVAPVVGGAQAQNAGYVQDMLNLQAGLLPITQSYTGINAGLANAAWQNAGQANAADQSIYGDYKTALGNAEQQDQSTLDWLTNQRNSYQPIAWGGDLTSQAAQAYADPASIAAQQQALGFLQGAANGALNYQSQGAQAYADPQAVQMQMDALNGLGGLVSSYNSGPSASDPYFLASAKDALSKYAGLTTPNVTSQERFIYEQARLAEEQQTRAARSAVMNDLRARGLSGSGMELTNMLGTEQQLSQNRVLSDLGAQANAISRSMQALQGQAALSSTMQGQGNALQGLYVDQTGQLRAQTFNEAYNRGIAADAASANNQRTQLQGGIASGDLASNMRQQSFTEAFDRGSAADQMSQFNRATSQQLAEYNQKQQFGMDTTVAQARFGVTANNRTDAGNIATMGLGVDQAGYTRNQGAIDTTSGLNDKNLAAWNGWVGGTTAALGTGINTNNAAAGNAIALGGLRTGTNQAGTQAITNAYQGLAGQQAADAATKIASSGGGSQPLIPQLLPYAAFALAAL